MSSADALRLLFLSAVWGASFLFMRVAAPEFGYFPLVLCRIGGAALVLLPVLVPKKNRQILHKLWFPFLILGLFNSALPFSLFSFAALNLEAGFSSLLNATTPIATAIVGFLWLRVPLKPLQLIGLAVGFAGIAILVSDRWSFETGGSGWSVLAILGATTSYGVAAHFAKRHLADAPSLVVTSGSLLFAALLLVPFALTNLPDKTPSANAVTSAAGLALLCTALAYVMFFDLLKRTTATAAATVTYIVPVFGILWGVLFLDESITSRIVLGMLVALAGTALVTGISRKRQRDRQ
ncbi:MAG: DMT family transporter [Verrucomicrobiales bacterium]|nr:DMT family transporter [Verrucomicrobiales bacterium]